MREQEPENQQHSQHHTSIVIEVFDDGPKHSVVTSYESIDVSLNPLDLLQAAAILETNELYVTTPIGKFYFLYLHKPSQVDFGDRLLWNPQENKWYLQRGDLLKYRLFLGDFPPQILNRLQVERNL